MGGKRGLYQLLTLCKLRVDMYLRELQELLTMKGGSKRKQHCSIKSTFTMMNCKIISKYLNRKLCNTGVSNIPKIFFY